MSLRKWTTKSVRTLQQGLQAQGHVVGQTTIRHLLWERDDTLQAHKKVLEGARHPDRDAQFAHIKEQCATVEQQGNPIILFDKTRPGYWRQCATVEQQGNPIIAVDCKTKELSGTFQNNGRAWQPKGQPVLVNVYDFATLGAGKAIP